jgi:hypothetical protein
VLNLQRVHAVLTQECVRLQQEVESYRSATGLPEDFLKRVKKRVYISGSDDVAGAIDRIE